VSAGVGAGGEGCGCDTGVLGADVPGAAGVPGVIGPVGPAGMTGALGVGDGGVVGAGDCRLRLAETSCVSSERATGRS